MGQPLPQVDAHGQSLGIRRQLPSSQAIRPPLDLLRVQGGNVDHGRVPRPGPVELQQFLLGRLIVHRPGPVPLGHADRGRSPEHIVEGIPAEAERTCWRQVARDIPVFVNLLPTMDQLRRDVHLPPLFVGQPLLTLGASEIGQLLCLDLVVRRLPALQVGPLRRDVRPAVGTWTSDPARRPVDILLPDPALFDRDGTFEEKPAVGPVPPHATRGHLGNRVSFPASLARSIHLVNLGTAHHAGRIAGPFSVAARASHDLELGAVLEMDLLGEATLTPKSTVRQEV